MHFARCLVGVAAAAAAYLLFVCLLALPAVQDQVVYLNKVTLTWFQDVNVPEQWGFLRGQVTPFRLATPDGESLHAWHILPLGLYRRHEAELAAEPSGLAPDVTRRLSFRLLRDDPDALLVLYLHGAAGTLASGWRPASYRAMSAGDPERIHTVAIDYRGFGESTGVPGEAGLVTDARALADWAAKVAGIPAARTVVFGQSLGTAVAVQLAGQLAGLPADSLLSPGLPADSPQSLSGLSQGLSQPSLSGLSQSSLRLSRTPSSLRLSPRLSLVLVAPLASVEQLTATYRLAGIVPLLAPLPPPLLPFFNRFVRAKWPTRDAIGRLVRTCEAASIPYRLHVLHAQDDYDIPWSHSDLVYWGAVDAAGGADEARGGADESRTDRGDGGWTVTHRTRMGVLTQTILRHGLHDRIMSYPAVSGGVLEAFGSSEQAAGSEATIR